MRKSKQIADFMLIFGAFASTSFAEDGSKSILPLSTSKSLFRPLVYSIEFTNPPCMIPRSARGEEGVIRRLSNCDAVLLSTHSNDVDRFTLDVELQVNSHNYTQKNLII